MNKDDTATLGRVRERAAAASPGPWHWAGYKNRRSGMGIYLGRWAHGLGRTVVMDTSRCGMQGAQPRFNVDNRMVDGVHLAVREVPYRDDVSDVDHPDARFIAHARQDVDDLLGIIDRLLAERDHVVHICSKHRRVVASCKCPGPHMTKYVQCPGGNCA